VVASKVGGIPELVKCGETGFLTQPDQLQEMIEHIKDIVMNRPMRERMSIAARNRALESYTPEAVAAKHVVIYQKLLAGSR
jgi:glycosyltransferase involved in cell wall biosynthesis